jgi:hypothetical protein
MALHLVLTAGELPQHQRRLRERLLIGLAARHACPYAVNQHRHVAVQRQVLGIGCNALAQRGDGAGEVVADEAAQAVGECAQIVTVGPQVSSARSASPEVN